VILRVSATGVLKVDDEGPGIAPEDYQQVLARFYRGSHNASDAGLGLAIVGEICQSHQPASRSTSGLACAGGVQRR
jgi:two-component system sensor histidine kinase TctE